MHKYRLLLLELLSLLPIGESSRKYKETTLKMDKSSWPESIVEYKQISEDLINLQKNLDLYLKDMQRQVIEKKHAFHQTLAELTEEEKRLTSLIDQHRNTEKDYLDLINKDLQKKDATLEKLKKLESERDDFLQQKRDVEDEIRRVNEEYENKSRDFHDKRSFIKEQLVLNNEKLLLFERLLGLTIDVESPETLRFTFKDIDPDDYTRSVSFTYNTVQESVVESDPELSTEIIQSIQKDYLQHKNIGYFWRDMRMNLKRQLTDSSNQ